MRKHIIVIAWISQVLFIGCDSDSHETIQGEVIDMVEDDTMDGVEVLLRTRENEEIGFTLTDDATITEFMVPEGKEKASQEGFIGDIVIMSYDKSNSVKATLQGQEIPVYMADSIEVEAYKMAESWTLSDGTILDLMQYYDRQSYRLPNGEKLITVDVNLELNPMYSGLEEVEPEVLERIEDYYRTQESIYNLEEELEKAYLAYRNRDEVGEGSSWSSFLIEDYVIFNVSGNQMLYFNRKTLLPDYKEYHIDYNRGAAFDGRTGEKVDNWDLFNIPPEKVKEALIEQSSIEEPEIQERIMNELKSEDIVFYPEYMSVTLQSDRDEEDDISFGFGLEYDENLNAILREEAVVSRNHEEESVVD